MNNRIRFVIQYTVFCFKIIEFEFLKTINLTLQNFEFSQPYSLSKEDK